MREIPEASQGVFQYDPKSGDFKRIPALDDLGITHFKPIADSSKVFVFSQSCGMGCPESKLSVFDSKEQSIKPFDITSDLLDHLKDGQSYKPMELLSLDSSKGEARFKIGYEDKIELGVLDIDENEWTFGAMSTGEIKTEGFSFCNPNYSFENNSGKFDSPPCGDKVENDEYKWSIVTSESWGDNSRIEQENKKTGEKTVIEIPGTELRYSPFADWKDPVLVTGMTYAEDLLWVGTTRGLSLEDTTALAVELHNPQTKKWNTLSTKEGLIDNSIVSFVVDGKAVWTTTSWIQGASSIGFSGIKY